MKKENILITWTVAIILLACSTDDASIKTIYLTPEDQIKQFSDSSYIHDIRAISFYDKQYYISSYERSQVYILNGDLEMIKTIGQKGKGPGELNGAGQLFVIDSIIYTKNDTRQGIEKYKINNKYIETIDFPPSFRMHSGLRFFVDNNKIYTSPWTGESLVSAFNYKNDSIFNFGEVKQFNTQRETSIKNGVHLVKHDELIIAIPIARPEIVIFNQYGELIKKFNYAHIKPVAETRSYIEKQPVRENSFYNVASDAYVHNNKLYILFLTINDDGNTETKNILKLEIDETTIIPQKIINLGDGRFGTFCMTDESLLTFDRLTGSLVKFNIENN